MESVNTKAVVLAGAPPTRVPSPPRMERYDVVRRVGKGSEGSVYLVRDRAGGGEFVVKKIFVQGDRRGALHEAHILAQLQHPHVVRYVDSFWDRENEHLCIVQAYCAGGTLQDVVRRAAEHETAAPSEPRVMSWCGARPRRPRRAHH
jgi:serine/threonine protein kinase